MQAKILSALLALIMALSIVPAAAAAETETTDFAAYNEAAVPSAGDDEQIAPQAEPVTVGNVPAPVAVSDVPTAEEPTPIEKPTEAPTETPTEEPAAPKWPAISDFSSIQNGVKISWSAYTGAYQYRLYVKNGTKWTKIAQTTALSFNHTGLKNNTVYTYTVRALDRAGNFVSTYNTQGWDNRFLPAPTLTAVSSVYGGLKVSWQAVPNAAGYRLYVKNNNKWKFVCNTASTDYLDTNVTSDKSYTYTVRCLNEDFSVLTSYYNKDGKTGTYVAAPVVTKLENTASGVKLTWSKVSGAAQYRLYYRDGSVWRKVGDTTAATYTHSGLQDGTTYTYTLRPLSAKGTAVGAYYTAGWSIRYLAPPAITSVTAKKDGMLIQWNAVEGIGAYRLYRKSLGGSWAKIADVSDTSYTDATAPTNLPYAYTVRCLNEDNTFASYYIADTVYYDKTKALGTGYKTYNKQKYYFSAGKLMTNNIVGSKKLGYYYADKNGVCCTSEEIRLAAEYMMKYCKGATLQEKMKSGFMYMAKNFPYNRTYDHPKKAADLPALAIDMFTKEKGNCFRYAACFACTAAIAGYRTRVVIGTVGIYNSPHGWVEVYVDGQWLICDPDAQLPSYRQKDYAAYMMKKHYWSLKPTVKCELTISNGKAIWK